METTRCTSGTRAGWTAHAELAVAMALVGTIAPASRIIGAAWPPFLAGALRLALAAALLAPAALARHRRELVRRFERHDLALLVTQAAAGSVAFTVLMLLGTARTSAAEASVVAGALPVVAACASALLFRERGGARVWVAAAIAGAGVAAAAWPRGGLRSGSLTGDLLVLAAVCCETLFILLQKRLRRPLPPLAQAAAMAVIGLLLALPAAAWEALHADLRAAPPVAWAALAWYALFPTVVGFVLWYRGAERVAGARAAIYTALVPLSGAAASAAVLGEPLRRAHVTGLVLVVAAIVLAARPRRSPPLLAEAPQQLLHALLGQRHAGRVPDRPRVEGRG